MAGASRRSCNSAVLSSEGAMSDSPSVRALLGLGNIGFRSLERRRAEGLERNIDGSNRIRSSLGVVRSQNSPLARSRVLPCGGHRILGFRGRGTWPDGLCHQLHCIAGTGGRLVQEYERLLKVGGKPGGRVCLVLLHTWFGRVEHTEMEQCWPSRTKSIGTNPQDSPHVLHD